jgi:hypothetical protein
MDASGAPQTRAALLTTASNTGWRFVGDVLMTRRISAVAVCCSRDSLRARARCSTSRSRSACDAPGDTLALVRWRSLPHSSQNLACGRFSCWHRGHASRRLPASRAGNGQDRWRELSLGRGGVKDGAKQLVCLRSASSRHAAAPANCADLELACTPLGFSVQGV